MGPSNLFFPPAKFFCLAATQMILFHSQCEETQV